MRNQAGHHGTALCNTKRIKAGLILAGLLLMQSVSVAGETYYVSQDGDNSNTGSSWANSWETLAHAGQQAIAGDTVIIRKGQTPYAYLPVSNSGQPGLPITFRGEFEDDPPVITGGKIAADWVASPTAGVWEHQHSGGMNHLVEDGSLLPRATSASCGDGQWFLESNAVHYRPTSGTPLDHEVWRSTSAGGAFIDNSSWIVLEDLYFWLGNGSGVSIKGGRHNVARRVHTKWMWRGVNLTDSATDNLIENCLVEENKEGIYIQENSSHNTIRNCRAFRNGNLPQWSENDRGGILIGGSGSNVGNVIENSEIAFNGGPDSDPGLTAYSAPDSILRNNYVHDNFGSGLFVTSNSDRSQVTGNIVERNGIPAVSQGYLNIAGLSVRRSKEVSVVSNRVWDNHLSPDNRWGTESGPRGGLEIRGLTADYMGNIQIIDNDVCGSVGGPDFYITPEPDLSGLVINPDPQTCSRAILPVPTNLTAQLQ